MINFPNCEVFHLFYKVTGFFPTEPFIVIFQALTTWLISPGFEFPSN